MVSVRRALALALTLGGLVAAGVPGGAQTATELVVAGPANDSGAEMFYANELGLFKKAGLNVRVDVINSAGSIASAVSSGAVTFGSLTVATVAVAVDKDIPLRIIAPGALYSSDPPTSGLVVLGDAPYKKAADLNGKTIGVRDIGNMNTLGAKAWMDANGGDSSTVHWLEIAEPQSVALMKQGRIDAASISLPAFANSMKDGARLMAPVYDAIAKSFLVGIYFTNDAYARAHPDVVRRFSDVIVEAGKWANTHRAESAKILEKYTQAPVPPDIPRVRYAEQLRAADVQPTLNVLLKFGAIKKTQRAADLFAAGIPSS